MYTFKTLGLFSFDGKLDSDPFKDCVLELIDEGAECITDSLKSTKYF